MWDERGAQPSPVTRSLRGGSSRGCGYQSELEYGPPVLDTYFKFGRRGKYPSPCLEVAFLRMFWEVGVLGEWKILVIF